jgi:hypothetical protein
MMWTLSILILRRVLGLRIGRVAACTVSPSRRHLMSVYGSHAVTRYFLAVMLVGVMGLPAYAEQVAQLTCQGMFMGTPAMVQGQRQYAPHNAVGDGLVRFSGVLQSDLGAARMMYEGYTRVGAFEGVLQAPQGVFPIAVLDNTGGQMIIYKGGASLGAPPMVGQFVCQWR